MSDEHDGLLLHDFQDNFTGLNNEILRDPRLDWDSLGLLLILKSYRPGTQFAVEKLVTAYPTRSKQRVLYRMMKELEEIGYVVRERRHVDGKLRTITTLTDKPIRKAEPQTRRNVESAQTRRNVDSQSVERSSKKEEESKKENLTPAARARVMRERAEAEENPPVPPAKSTAPRRIKRSPSRSVEPTPPSKMNAVTLSNYFAERVAVSYGDMRALQANKAAVAKQISVWIKEHGMAPEDVKGLVDIYCTNPGLRREGVADWKLFIRGRDRLLAYLDNYKIANMTEEQKAALHDARYDGEISTNIDQSKYDEEWV